MKKVSICIDAEIVLLTIRVDFYNLFTAFKFLEVDCFIHSASTGKNNLNIVYIYDHITIFTIIVHI